MVLCGQSFIKKIALSWGSGGEYFLLSKRLQQYYSNQNWYAALRHVAVVHLSATKALTQFQPVFNPTKSITHCIFSSQLRPIEENMHFLFLLSEEMPLKVARLMDTLLLHHSFHVSQHAVVTAVLQNIKDLCFYRGWESLYVRAYFHVCCVWTNMLLLTTKQTLPSRAGNYMGSTLTPASSRPWTNTPMQSVPPILIYHGVVTHFIRCKHRQIGLHKHTGR